MPEPTPSAHAEQVREIGRDRLYAGLNQSREIARWAQRHYGLISRRKLLALGLSEDEIDVRRASGLLLPASARGIYHVGHVSHVAGQREALALAGSGPGAALAGVSAAAWLGMTEPWRGPVHVIARPGRSAPFSGVVRHRDRLDPADVTKV